MMMMMMMMIRMMMLMLAVMMSMLMLLMLMLLLLLLLMLMLMLLLMLLCVLMLLLLCQRMLHTLWYPPSDRIDVDGSGTLDRNEISMLATKMVRRPLFCACRAVISILAQSPTIRNRVED